MDDDNDCPTCGCETLRDDDGRFCPPCGWFEGQITADDLVVEALEVEPDPDFDDEPFDGFMTDAEADADVLASAGWGTDEDYGDW